MLINWMELKRHMDGSYYVYIEKLQGDRIDLPKPYWRLSPLGILQYKRGNTKTDEKYKKLLIKLTIDRLKKELLEAVEWHADAIDKIGRAK